MSNANYRVMRIGYYGVDTYTNDYDMMLLALGHTCSSSYQFQIEEKPGLWRLAEDEEEAAILRKCKNIKILEDNTTKYSRGKIKTVHHRHPLAIHHYKDNNDTMCRVCGKEVSDGRIIAESSGRQELPLFTLDCACPHCGEDKHMKFLSNKE